MNIDYNNGEWHFGPIYNKPEEVHYNSTVEYVWHDPNRDTTGITVREAGRGIAWSHVMRFRVLKVYKPLREYWICGGIAFTDEDSAIAWSQKFNLEVIPAAEKES